jgi:hypothetical protein
VPKYTPAGSFSVAQVTVVDHNGNATYYDDYGSTPSDPYSIALQSGWQTKVTLTGKGPTRPAKKESGKLASFHFSPTTIDATKGAKKVRLVATFTGRQPHSVFASFQGFNDGDGGIDSDGTFKRHGHTWTGRMTVSQWIGNHTYRPDLEVDYTSRTKPFHRTYSPDLLAARFATTTLKVKSSIDGTPPALTGLSITPSSVNTVSGAETLTVKATAVDPKSGVRSINASFSTNDGNVTGGAASGSYPYAGVGYSTDGDVNVHFTHTKGNTWTGKALFHSCEPNGKWHINVDVEDHARNDRNYSPGRLAKAKLPSTLQVTSTPGDIVAPYIYGSTSSSQDGTITLDFSEGVKNVTTTDLTVYPESPAKTRYRMPDPISSITCSNGHATVDCSGTGGLITSAVLAVPALSGQVGTKYEVWTNLGSTSSQLTDGTGNPMDWTSDVAEVTDS